MIAGINFSSEPIEPRAPSTNASEPRSPVIFLSEVAIVRIRIAGTIAIKPLGIQFIASLKDTIRLMMK